MRRTKTFSFSVATFFLVLLMAEIISAVGLRFAQGEWIYTAPANDNYKLFEPDAKLVGVPRKNISVVVNGIHYGHNADGFRGKALENTKSKKRILCIGGSTTYGIGVSNHETWPYYLDSLLQPEYEILNLGVPGHSSVEHKKQLPSAVAKYAPYAVILHCGLNDFRNMNIVNFGDDYSGLHQPWLHASLGFCAQDRLPRIALVHVVFLLLQNGGFVAECPFRNEAFEGSSSDMMDGRVVKIYRNNLDTILMRCAEKNIPVYLVPQILSQEKVTDKNLKWWIPYLTKQGIFNALDTMNTVMQSRADGLHACFIDLEQDEWTKDEFYDASHLNAKGNEKLAETIAKSIVDYP